ncbi:hypothetical protein Tco_0643913 [Tanacetum coccineum]
MMLNSIENGSLVYGTIEENGVTRDMTYVELTDAEKHQDNCDVKATNIILQGLPLDQERECKLYDDFDRFTSVKGESLHEYYLLFSQPMNDMYIIGMTMQQVQVNTKFLNTLPPKWSKFVTNVKLARKMHTTNYDQLYAYLSQHEAHATEVRLMRESTILLTINNSHPQLLNIIILLKNIQSLMKQLLITNSLAVPSFQPGDDLIACLNKAMAFMSTVMASRFSSSDNQLKTSSNLRNQVPFKMAGLLFNKYKGDRVRVLLAQESSQELDEEQLAFLADSGVADGQAT